MPDSGWDRAFDDPVPLPGGSELRTLRDDRRLITKLTKREHDTFAWCAPIEALILVVEHGGDTMLPHIGMESIRGPVELGLKGKKSQ